MTQFTSYVARTKCEFCGCIVEIKEGTVLYGTMWYHQKCWDAKSRGD